MVLPVETLACAITRYHFQPVVGEVVRLLLANPGSTLARVSSLFSSFCEKQHVCKEARQSPVGDNERLALVRGILTVLIQHGIVFSRELQNGPTAKQQESTQTATSPGLSASRPSQGTYFVNTDELLFRIRLPLYLGCVRKAYGEIGNAAVRAIFERGRLSVMQIFRIALNAMLDELDITVDQAEACLCDMARSGLLHWYGERSASQISGMFANDIETGTSSGIPITSQNGKKRPRCSEVTDTGVKASSMGKPCSSPYEERIIIGRGEHIREVGALRTANDVDIWGVSFWHLNREFRNECCGLMVEQRVKNELSARVLRAGLRIALLGEDCEQPSEDFETADISTESIQRELEEQYGAISNHDFWAATSDLIKQTPPCVVAIPEHAPTSLRFVPGRLVSETRQKTFEDLVMKRYTTVGHRIFRALLIEGAMEEKMIAEKCLLPLKVVREHLLNMYQDRIILIQEVPRSNDQQRASNWYYLWVANPLGAYRGMVEVMYKAVGRLFIRLEQLGIKDSSAEDKRKALLLQESLLTASILRIDQSIMVMRDFGDVSAAYLPARYRIIDGQIGKVRRRG